LVCLQNLYREHFANNHTAHLNLRNEYLPYKYVIAEVLIDKNPTTRTVINKVDDVGANSEFRTFGYEVLAGPDDMKVELSEGNCIFKFDYSKVYWNSRLQTEHKRLVDSFQAGEVVCDVMAGIGPFAVPAGKKGVFVLANDLNPDSYEALKDAIARNKVSPLPLILFPSLFVHGHQDTTTVDRAPKFGIFNEVTYNEDIAI
jgi:tRNA (guanine37-N1)-methyltransferase